MRWSDATLHVLTKKRPPGFSNAKCRVELIARLEHVLNAIEADDVVQTGFVERVFFEGNR
jgi:hypothetical protein